MISTAAIAALTAGTFHQAPAYPDVKLQNLTLVAMPLPRALEAISSASGQRLETIPLMTSEIVVVQAKEIGLPDLMQSLATVTTGRWETTANGWRLVPNQPARNTEAQTELVRQADGIRAQLNEIIKPPKPSDPEMGEEGGSATRILMARIAATIDPSIYLNLDPINRMVLSSAPTAMQRPLPGSARALIGQLIVAHNKEAEEPGEMPDFSAVPELQSLPPEMRNLLNRRPTTVKDVAKSNLVISSSFLGGIQFEIRTYDPTGKQVMQHSLSVGSGIERWLARFREGAANANAPKPNETKVTYRPETLEFQKAFPKISFDRPGAFTQPVLTPEIKAVVSRPDLFDPLSFDVTDEVIALANAANRPLVAVLPDNQSEATTMTTAARTVQQVQAVVDAGSWITRIDHPTLALYRPAFPNRARRERTDRVALARLVQAALARPAVSLDDMAAFAASQREPADDSVGQMYLQRFVPNINNAGIQGEVPWAAYQLYASLNPVVRQTLGGGGTVPLTALASGPTASLLFGPTARVTSLASTPTETDPFMAGMMMAMGQSGDAKTEPTEIMPQGIPGAGVLSVQVQNDLAFVPSVTNMPSNVFGVVGLDEIAMLEMFKDQKEFKEMQEFMPKITGVKVGTRRVYTFTMLVGPDSVVRYTLNDDSIDPGTTSIPLTSLSAEHRKMLDARIERFKKSPMMSLINSFGSMGRPGAVPP